MPERRARIGIIAAVVVGLATAWRLAVIARGHDAWAVGDGAMIEFYTLHALHGAQVLGAYSQYGWHHPGPALFYVLAPFYAVSHESSFGLNVGALTVNIACLAVALWAARKGRASPFLALLLPALLLFYVARLPALLTSFWNPHIPVISFSATLTATAAALAGVAACLPIVAVLATFNAQAHVAFAPVGALLVAIAFLGLARHAATHKGCWAAFFGWTLASVLALDVMWVLPVSDEIAGGGNMTEIWRFFMAGGELQSFALAWHAWSSAMLWAFSPGFFLAAGLGFEPSTSFVVGLLATITVFALVPASAAQVRAGQTFDAALAFACFVASTIAFWSVQHVRGNIGDYQVFWLSILGVMNVAILLAWAASSGALRPDAKRWRAATLVASAAAVAIAAVLGVREHNRNVASGYLDDSQRTVRDIVDQTLHNMPVLGGQRPLIRLDPSAGAPTVGFLLEMVKRYPVPVTVEHEPSKFFGSRLDATGTEDLLVTVSGPEVHQQLMTRPHNKLLASRYGQIFVDAVSLVDEPEYRPATGR